MLHKTIYVKKIIQVIRPSGRGQDLLYFFFYTFTHIIVYTEMVTPVSLSSSSSPSFFGRFLFPCPPSQAVSRIQHPIRQSFRTALMNAIYEFGQLWWSLSAGNGGLLFEFWSFKNVVSVFRMLMLSTMIRRALSPPTAPPRVLFLFSLLILNVTLLLRVVMNRRHSITATVVVTVVTVLWSSTVTAVERVQRPTVENRARRVNATTIVVIRVSSAMVLVVVVVVVAVVVLMVVAVPAAVVVITTIRIVCRG